MVCSRNFRRRASIRRASEILPDIWIQSFSLSGGQVASQFNLLCGYFFYRVYLGLPRKRTFSLCKKLRQIVVLLLRTKALSASSKRVRADEITRANCNSSANTTFATRSAVSFSSWISHSHLIPHGQHHLVHERLLLPQQPSVPNTAPQNLTQHIPTPFIRRLHAIGNQERRRARMVRNKLSESRILLRRSTPGGRSPR